jgi:hypothetical protein
MEKRWILGIYTSGGTAHERAMQELCCKQEGIQSFNLFNSTSTFFPFIGRLLGWMWDRSQRKGKVRRQILLGHLQHLADRFFFLPTYWTLRQLFSRRSPPEKVLVTSPLFFGAVCKAAFEAGVSAVHLYMVEPPSEAAGYYFNTIKKLPQKQRERLILYAQHPMQEDLAFYEGEENYWHKKAGLRIDQICFDPPVKEVFKNARSALPYPGQQLSLTLEGYPDPFSIASQDRVGLIMLGGVPTVQALYDYLESVIALAHQYTATSKNFLFVACGKRLEFYEKMKARLKNYEIPSHLQVIPFFNQPVEQIFGRADFTITRSGGMTSLEILELKKREKDDKLILIHAEIQGKELHLSEEALIRQGIPLWEGGNARYLQKTIPGTRIVTPQDAGPHIAKKFYPLAPCLYP